MKLPSLSSKDFISASQVAEETDEQSAQQMIDKKGK